eukprot:10977164-Karenia_brevis.AAC.1
MNADTMRIPNADPPRNGSNRMQTPLAMVQIDNISCSTVFKARSYDDKYDDDDDNDNDDDDNDDDDDDFGQSLNFSRHNGNDQAVASVGDGRYHSRANCYEQVQYQFYSTFSVI